jgi:hypothetical protein
MFLRANFIACSPCKKKHLSPKARDAHTEDHSIMLKQNIFYTLLFREVLALFTSASRSESSTGMAMAVSTWISKAASPEN